MNYKLTALKAGQIFNRWTVIKPDPTQRRSGKTLCRCDCGVQRHVATSTLVSGLTKSCGCYSHERSATNLARYNVQKRKYADPIPGTRFGRLTVICVLGGNDRLVRCQCQCGNEAAVKLVHLCRPRRPTRSCGCLARDNMRSVVAQHWALPPGGHAFNKLLYIYRNTCARERGLPFELSAETFKQLTSKPCVYCGTLPSQEIKTTRGVYRYNGLDRLYNTKGYLEYNCAPCCGQCNRSKRQQTTQEFMAWARSVYVHRPVTRAFNPVGALMAVRSPRGKWFGQSALNQLLSSYRDKAQLRGYSFELTEAQFVQLTLAPCYYCGSSPAQWVGRPGNFGRYCYNGLDRVDNAKGYTLSNVVPCCQQCNAAKSSQTKAQFYRWIARLASSPLVAFVK